MNTCRRGGRSPERPDGRQPCRAQTGVTGRRRSDDRPPPTAVGRATAAAAHRRRGESLASRRDGNCRRRDDRLRVPGRARCRDSCRADGESSDCPPPVGTVVRRAVRLRAGRGLRCHHCGARLGHARDTRRVSAVPSSVGVRGARARHLAVRVGGRCERRTDAPGERGDPRVLGGVHVPGAPGRCNRSRRHGSRIHSRATRRVAVAPRDCRLRRNRRLRGGTGVPRSRSPERWVVRAGVGMRAPRGGLPPRDARRRVSCDVPARCARTPRVDGGAL